MRQRIRSADVTVAAIVLTCFLLGSTGWLLWLYNLADMAPAQTVDVLTMVVGYLMQAVGVGVFTHLVRDWDGRRVRVTATVAIAVYVACLVPAVLSQSLGPALAFGYLANLMCGGFMAYYLMCLSRSVDAARRGVVFGGAYAVSTLVSWALSAIAGGVLTRGWPGLAACLVLALGAAALVWRRSSDAAAADDDVRRDAGVPGIPPVPKSDEDVRRTVALCGVAVVLMSVVKGAGFSFPTDDLMAGVPLELSRLLYGVGLLAAGLVNDKDRRYGALLCEGALVTPFLMLSLSGAAVPVVALWGMGYLLFGFFTVYRVLLFADLADSWKLPTLAALGMLLGRVGDALGTALVAVLGETSLWLIVVTAVLFACTVAIFFLLGKRLYAPEVEPALSEQERFDRFAARHDLSVREREVLQLVLAGRSNREVAAELCVSESTVKYHVRNVLRKTGSHSRKELLAAYADTTQ